MGALSSAFGGSLGALIGVFAGIAIVIAMFVGSCTICAFGGAKVASDAAKIEQQRVEKSYEPPPIIQETKPQPTKSAPVKKSPPAESIVITPRKSIAPTTSAAPESAEKVDRSPWVVWGGDGYSMYHSPNCERAPKGSKSKRVRRSEMEDLKNSPCKICKPDQLPDEP